MEIIRLEGIERSYPGAVTVRALKGVSATIAQGEFIAIEGPSGGGKSTLLNILGLLDAPSSGEYILAGRNVSGLKGVASARARSDYFAFIFQNFHLLDRRRVIDSVELGLLYRGLGSNERHLRAAAALEAVGLAQQATQKANTLSGGQRQRVAIARALASAAPIVVADEPTGNLDSENSAMVLDNLRRVQNLGATVIMVTHSPELASRADRRFRISDGLIREEGDQAGLAMTSHNSVKVGAAPPRVVPGAPSRVRLVDLMTDGLRSLVSRPARTLALIAAVALGVGLAVATAGVSLSAQAQVSDAFNAHLNRDVSLRWPLRTASSVSSPARSANDATLPVRLQALAGVDAAAIVSSYSNIRIQVNLTREAFSVGGYAVAGDLARASRSKIHWAARHGHGLVPGEALLGSSLAAQAHLGAIDLRPSVLIEGRHFTVVGLIEAAPRVPDFLGSVVVSPSQLGQAVSATSVRALLLTKPGAAQQVARQAPLVVDPYQPRTLQVTAPVDPTTLRNQVESNVQVTLLIVTGVALLGSIAGLTNAMILAVTERRQEIGLRRALGALPRQIGGLILLESCIVGLLGGLVGLSLGLVGILATTITQHWIPVFDLTLAPAAVAGGILVGSLSGILASARASRIQPTEALRL